MEKLCVVLSALVALLVIVFILGILTLAGTFATWVGYKCFSLIRSRR